MFRSIQKRRHRGTDSGAVAVEYTIVIGFVVMLLIASLAAFGPKLSKFVEDFKFPGGELTPVDPNPKPCPNAVWVDAKPAVVETRPVELLDGPEPVFALPWLVVTSSSPPGFTGQTAYSKTQWANMGHKWWLGDGYEYAFATPASKAAQGLDSNTAYVLRKPTSGGSFSFFKEGVGPFSGQWASVPAPNRANYYLPWENRGESYTDTRYLQAYQWWPTTAEERSHFSLTWRTQPLMLNGQPMPSMKPKILKDGVPFTVSIETAPATEAGWVCP